MGSVKRISYFFLGLLMILSSFVMFTWPEIGYELVLLILELTLLIHGIRQLVFYGLMARHMVGGINVFYNGLFYLDAGLFTLYLSDMPRIYVMIYLIGCMLFSGVTDAAHANEMRKQKFRHWKYELFSGLVKVLISLVCLFHINSMEIIAIVYGIGLLHSAVTHIVTAFRRTAIVYVQ